MADYHRYLFSCAFSCADAERAADQWGANCGPGALAAIFNMTLDQVRPHLGDFDQKRYTNPTMMYAALRALGVAFDLKHSKSFPCFGLARIQWEGPWTAPGVPARVAYGKTHWVASRYCERRKGTAIFDINAMSAGGWISSQLWQASVVPWILEHCVPKATGRWHVTHSIEIGPSGRELANRGAANG